MTALQEKLGIRHPFFIAPMFLVSNLDMLKAAFEAGITGAIPALNFRSSGELRAAIRTLKSYSKIPFGINLIVNKSNPRLSSQLAVCLEEKVGFIITSLGNPAHIIAEAHREGILVFCDVTDLHFAQKVEGLGADAVVAVNSRAGGHSGPYPEEKLIPLLKSSINIPIISAGGTGRPEDIKQALGLGADLVSVGTLFICTHESPVNPAYKNAIIEHGAKDIVHTTRLSGTPCTVINTEYVKANEGKAGWLETLIKKHPRIKKWAKLILAWRGFKELEKAAFKTTYKTVWVAGPSIEYVKRERGVKEVVAYLAGEETEKSII